MPWKKVTAMESRLEFVRAWESGVLSISELSRRFGVSRKTAYKWVGRFESHGQAGLEDRSRRPMQVRSPTPPEVVQKVLEVRDAHPRWGGRKIRRVLQRQGELEVPSPSTITSLLEKAGRIKSVSQGHRGPWKRFERTEPNELWQLDFKGGAYLSDTRLCHPLSVIDDHSRYALGLSVCADQGWEAAYGCFKRLFERFGLPLAILSDNGVPWGNPYSGRFSRCDAWLMRLGVEPIHGRVRHPETQGKVERFHRTLEGEVMCGRSFHSLEEMDEALASWREVYNHQRPHDALGLDTPAMRYRPSPRPMPKTLAEIVYSPQDRVGHADKSGLLRFEGRRLRVGHAFGGEPLAFRSTTVDGVWEVYFCTYLVGGVDLKKVGKGEFKFIGLPGYEDSAGQSNELFV